MAAGAQEQREFGRRREAPRISITTNGRVREFTVSTGWMVTLVGALGLFTIGYIGATGYLLFRDELIGAVISRQIRMQHGYEDRIASLRAQIDRINSRQLLDQEAFEARIETLMARQDALKKHEGEVVGLVERARAGGVILPPVPDRPEAATAVDPLKPTPKEKPFRASSWLDPFVSGRRSPAPTRAEARIAAAEAAIESHAKRQLSTINTVAMVAERDARRIETVVGRLGLKLGEAKSVEARRSDKPPPAAPAGPEAIGGPLVPLDPTVLMRRAETAMDRLAGVRRSAALLPLGTPVGGEPQVTSTFGNRNDPFLGVPAMHTGVDFRADTGDPVLATGAGTVTEAGRQGGYGLMVEIDHGNGLTTRYGHLSRISVDAGTVVRPGQLIGHAGSTGRSTGPHLHYETRVNGDPINPMGWLGAGEELGSLVR